MLNGPIALRHTDLYTQHSHLNAKHTHLHTQCMCIEIRCVLCVFVNVTLPNSISGSPIYFSVENLNTAHMSACVLKFAVFVNVTGRIPELDHRFISQ